MGSEPKLKKTSKVPGAELGGVGIFAGTSGDSAHMLRVLHNGDSQHRHPRQLQDLQPGPHTKNRPSAQESRHYSDIR